MENKSEIDREVLKDGGEQSPAAEAAVSNEDLIGSLEGFGDICSGEQKLSKKQIKRLKKQQVKMLHRKEKRAKEKLKKKMKRQAERMAGHIPCKKPRFSQMKDSKCKQRVAVDMQFQSLMPLKDIRRIFVQLSHAYGLNRRAENPLQLSIVNFSGVQSKIFYANPSNHHWDVMFDERPLDSVFEKTDIVYLTADSKNVLQKLDSSKVYVIGGLLDHNSLKGHCLEIAKKEGYAHARLPIDEHVSVTTGKVLTINQVFQVLLRYTENNSWKQSFLEVIPRRKGVLSIMERFELMNGYIQKNDAAEPGDTIDNNIQKTGD